MATVIKLTKPPKPISEMTDDERRRYAADIHAAMKQQRGGK